MTKKKDDLGKFGVEKMPKAGVVLGHEMKFYCG